MPDEGKVLAVTSLGELDVYQVAYVCGGPQRVALAAVAAMAQDGRITISRTRHRVRVVHRVAVPPVERAVLAAVPVPGTVLGPLLEGVADSDAVRELIEGLRRGGLVGRHSVVGHPHLSAAGHAARKELAASGVAAPGERRVAILGTAGIADAGLRRVFETPDPPLDAGRAGRGTREDTAPRTYRQVPSDPPVPGYPGVPGRW